MTTYRYKSDTIKELLDTYEYVIDTLPANWEACLAYFLNTYVNEYTADYKIELKPSSDEGFFCDHNEFTLLYNDQGLVNFMRNFKEYCKKCLKRISL